MCWVMPMLQSYEINILIVRLVRLGLVSKSHWKIVLKGISETMRGDTPLLQIKRNHFSDLEPFF